MSTCLRGGLWGFLLLGSVFYVGAAWSEDFASGGAQGVLEINVTVEGAGSEQGAPGAGWKSKSWSVKHTATYRLAMVAQAAIINGELSDSTDGDADDADRENYWDKKTEACGGDSTCEMQVAMEQMSDPRAQAEMQQIGEMMSAASTRPGAPANAQTWRIASRSGSVQIEQHDNAFGVISETGGLADVRCTSRADQALDPKPPVATGPMPAVLTIDGNSPNYTLLLPLEDHFMLKRLCTTDNESTEDTRRDVAPLLGDGPTGASDWGSVLQIEDAYTGGPAAPTFEGNKVLQAAVFRAPNRKATVTIGWRFRPDRS